MDPLIGREIGPYVITEWLGEGGMAVVYKAHQPSLRRYVAIKILTGVLSRDEELVSRFRREAVAAGGLGHPNILTIYDAGTTEDGLHYIVMEYVPGGTVKDLLRQGPLLVDRACDIAAQIADALQAAHDHGIIHRDLKPSNILLAGDGRPLLMDFGVALTAREPRLTRTGLALGTPEYMSPEQAQGKPVDGRTDVYALGALLYEMLSGEVLFIGETPLATMYRHVHEAPPDLAQMPGVQVPGWLAGVVSRALAKQPEERYQTAGEMAAALRSRTAPHPVQRPSAVVEEPEIVVPPQPVPALDAVREPARAPVRGTAPPTVHRPIPSEEQPEPSSITREPSPPTAPPRAARKKRPRCMLIVAVFAIAITCLTCYLASRAIDEWDIEKWESGTPFSFSDLFQPETFLTLVPSDVNTARDQTATTVAAAIATREASETEAASREGTATALAAAAGGPQAEATRAAQAEGTAAAARALAGAIATAEAEATRVAEAEATDAAATVFAATIAAVEAEITGVAQSQGTAAAATALAAAMAAAEAEQTRAAQADATAAAASAVAAVLATREADATRAAQSDATAVAATAAAAMLATWEADATRVAQADATAVAATAEAAILATWEAQAEATAIVIATRAAAATATALAIDSGEYEWDLRFYDDFSADEGTWDTGDYDSGRLSGSRRIEGGRYIWEAEANSGVAWWDQSWAGPLTDFDLSVYGRQVSGSSSASYGVMFGHEEDGNHYYFRIRDIGEYQLVLIRDGDSQVLINWTPTDSVIPRDFNWISVVAIGPFIEFWLNGEPVAEIEDPFAVAGDVGLVVGFSQAGDRGEFEFAEFEVYAPVGQ